MLKKRSYLILVIGALVCPHSNASPPVNYALEKDWLLDDEEFKASVTVEKNADGELAKLTLSNGLLAREFTLRPSVATTVFRNLATNNEIVRTTEPEARVTIDGVEYLIGGLQANSNRAFIDPSHFFTELPNKNAELIDYEIGEIEAPLTWNQNARYHAPDVHWPPKGKHLSMRYRLLKTDRSVVDVSQSHEILFVERFDNLAEYSTNWREVTDETAGRSSFRNEGKLGEFYTPQDSSCYLERDIPSSFQVIDLAIDAGTDVNGKTANPGLALLSESALHFKVSIRQERSPTGRKDSLFVESTAGGSAKQQRHRSPYLSGTPIRLRLIKNSEKGSITLAIAEQFSSTYSVIGVFQQDIGDSGLLKLRVGKLSPLGGDVRAEANEPYVRGLVSNVTIYGAEKQGWGDSVNHQDVVVTVNYNIYDGIPLISKWITVENQGAEEIVVNSFANEILSVVEEDVRQQSSKATPANTTPTQLPNLRVETNYCAGAMDYQFANAHAVHWERDLDYVTQAANFVNNRKVRLVTRPEFGPEQTVPSGETFRSFDTYVMPYDSFDKSRKSLAIAKFHKITTPWITEVNLTHHLNSSVDADVRNAIEQAAEVGFDSVVFSFGSRVAAHTNDTELIDRLKNYSEYAKSLGIELGAYSLYYSRSLGPPEDDMQMPDGFRPVKVTSLLSPSGQRYLQNLRTFFRETGFKTFIQDGSYPGTADVTPRPPHSKGILDSRWLNHAEHRKLYEELRAEDVYIRSPDWHFLNGASLAPGGYREHNWSLPRAQQRIHTRQNIHDRTFHRPPSMSWMFIPLAQYHGGGAAATVEPLEQHLDHYETMLMSNWLLGVQPTMRGPRLYDSDKTKSMVERCIGIYKKHIEIFESPLLNLTRANYRNLDYFLHVNPNLAEKGCLVVFNPSNKRIRKTIRFSTYYTGIQDEALVFEKEGQQAITKQINRDRIALDVDVPAGGYTYFFLKQAVN